MEKAIVGNRKYWMWISCLGALIVSGSLAYLRQLDQGLGITGLSRDVTWGLYIGQFTFLVGVAASAVMVLLPYYFHHVKAFQKVTILGEFLAIAAVTMCMLFILVDMGRPERVLNVILYPTLTSMMFWDMISLGGYLLLNVVIALVTLRAERNDLAPPAWIKPVIVLSIPWAVSIHTVTALLYSGLPGRPFWLTAILAPRFLASAFASGPALLILLCMLLSRLAPWELPRQAVQKLALIVTYAMTINVFLFLMELFTSLYSGIPEHSESLRYLFVGLEGHAGLTAGMWASAVLSVISLVLLIVPRYRDKEALLALACGMVFVSIWLDKGIGLIVAGFQPSPQGGIADYVPTLPELRISLGIWAVGALILTLLCGNLVAERPVRAASRWAIRCIMTFDELYAITAYAGLAIFIGLFTLLLWRGNVAVSLPTNGPQLAMPAVAKECVAPVEFMKVSHRQLMLDWRDQVVRYGNRRFTAFNGKTYDKNLTSTCLQECHGAKADYCDRCHDYADKSLDCWNCHLDARPAFLKSSLR